MRPATAHLPVLVALILGSAEHLHADAFADRVDSFVPGSYLFGTTPPNPGDEQFVLGPPDGSFLSVGLGGQVTMEFVDNPVVDGPGSDLQVNAFLPGSGSQELDNSAEVWASGDGFSYVFLGNIGPGGESYLLDLGEAGLQSARFVRVVDSGACCLSGNPEGGGDGFNVESAQALHVRVPVLLVHGWRGCPNDSTWGHMKRQLEEDGFTVHYFDNVPLTSRGCQRTDVSIEGLAALLSAKVKGIRDACGNCQVDVVAHSMGGLVARAWVTGQAVMSPRYRYSRGAIRRFVSIGTPNFGVLGLPDPLLGTQDFQMQRGSRFLWELHMAMSGQGPRGEEGRLNFRAIDSVAIVGVPSPLFDTDGLVDKNSANLRPYDVPEHVVPYWHSSAIESACTLPEERLHRCVAYINGSTSEDRRTHETYRLIRSHLSGTPCEGPCGGPFEPDDAEILLGILGPGGVPLTRASLANVKLSRGLSPLNLIRKGRGGIFYAAGLPADDHRLRVGIRNLPPLDCALEVGSSSLPLGQVTVLTLTEGGLAPPVCSVGVTGAPSNP